MASFLSFFKKTTNKKAGTNSTSKTTKKQRKAEKQAAQKAKKMTNKINKEIECKMAKDHENEEIKILLLGPGDSGKTTIVKQMKHIHGTLTEQEQKLPSFYIKQAVVTYMSILCRESQELNFENGEYKTECSSDVKNYLDAFIDGRVKTLNDESAHQIAELWKDPGIKRTLELRHKFQIHDNVGYFLDKVHEIAAEDYSPSFEDYIRMRSRTSGFQSHKFQAKINGLGDKHYNFNFIDVGGQRNERKKWLFVMKEDVQAVLFVVALSEYDMQCFEDASMNRMHEAIELFKSTVGSNFMNDKSTAIFLNKYDLFKEKIKTVPITVAFEDYPADQNPHDIQQTSKFIASKFQNIFSHHVKGIHNNQLHIYTTTALDTNNVSKLFHGITTDLVKKNLAQYAIL